MSQIILCPLCRGVRTYRLPCAERLYHRCLECRLVFLDKAQRLNIAAEKAIYDTHDNRVEDPGYRRFLQRSLDSMRTHVESPATGLDFGCGPAPALAAMAREAGYRMLLYDKFYAADPAALDRSYDFICCTEVVEHLADPAAELGRLWSLLAPGGPLVIQTKRVLDDQRFRAWHYRRDPTHIVFFAAETFGWLARTWSAALTFPHDDVAVLLKTAAIGRQSHEKISEADESGR